MGKELEDIFDDDIPVLSSMADADQALVYDASASTGSKIKRATLTVWYTRLKTLFDTAYGQYVVRWPVWAEVSSKPAIWAGALRNLGSVTGAVAVDSENYSHIEMTLTGNVTLNFTIPTTPFYGVWTMGVTQDVTGGHSITWGSGTRYHGGGTALAPSASANFRDVYTFFYNGNDHILIGFTNNIVTTGF